MRLSFFGLTLTLLLGMSVFSSAVLAGAGNPISLSWAYPVGGESVTSATQITLSWNASVSGPPGNAIGQRDVLVSFDNGTTFEPLALQIYEGESVQWFVRNKPTTQARFRVVVGDFLGNSRTATTGPVTIVRAAGGLLLTTERDFEAPGTQPLGVVRGNGEIGVLNSINTPDECRICHASYDPSVAPYEHWRGSMMAHASIDPIFKAALDINERTAPGSGDTCLRCHVPTAWYGGRSNPNDGSAAVHEDMTGVSCDLCHRMVDPIANAGNPAEDTAILADTSPLPPSFGQAMLVVDPENTRRRGPFVVPPEATFHGILISPFHQEAALCGTCHDVSNPAISQSGSANGTLNTLDAPHPSFLATAMMAEQRTYSEWFFSAFNTPQGVYAPQFGGNRDYVASCQDCHMRDVTGRGCFSENAPIRSDQPLHDLTGANTWVPTILDQVDPSVAEPIIEVQPGVFVEMGIVWLQDGINRARYMLQNASELTVDRLKNQLRVRVTNNTGHKLPTGYPEGRRIWLNVKFFNASNQLVSESGAYNPATGVLTHDAQLKLYETVPVIDATIAAIVGLPANTPNYLVLSNKMLKDNRIPPLGFSNAAYTAFGGAPVGAVYADGQNWDQTLYNVPAAARRAEVRLFHQVTTKEYMEFLRDVGGVGSPGELMHQLWQDNNKAPPELMETANFQLGLAGDMNCDGVVTVGDIGGFVLALTNPAQYAVQYPSCSISYADINGDGQITVGDIGLFVALLTGG